MVRARKAQVIVATANGFTLVFTRRNHAQNGGKSAQSETLGLSPSLPLPLSLPFSANLAPFLFPHFGCRILIARTKTKRQSGGSTRAKIILAGQHN